MENENDTIQKEENENGIIQNEDPSRDKSEKDIRKKRRDFLIFTERILRGIFAIVIVIGVSLIIQEAVLNINEYNTRYVVDLQRIILNNSKDNPVELIQSINEYLNEDSVRLFINQDNLIEILEGIKDSIINYISEGSTRISR